MVQYLTIEERISLLEAATRVSADYGTAGCTAERPHPGQLVYLRGPNRYDCPCGKSYLKDGAGGLKDVS